MRFFKLSSLLILALCVSGACLADQVRPAKDGATIEVAIAKDAPTRIRIQGDRIVDVVGNVQSSSGCDARSAEAGSPPTATPQLPTAATNPRGDVALTCNLEKGEVFVTLQPAATSQSACLCRRHAQPIRCGYAGQTSKRTRLSSTTTLLARAMQRWMPGPSVRRPTYV